MQNCQGPNFQGPINKMLWKMAELRCSDTLYWGRKESQKKRFQKAIKGS